MTRTPSIGRPYVVEQIADFATRATPADLTPEVRLLMKRNILDSLGCALGALPGKPFVKLREQAVAFGRSGRCTLIGGGHTSPDEAALYNSGLVRYVDLLDSFMGPGGLCHPADNFGGVLATADATGASGEDFMLALAVAYEVAARFTAAVPVMGKGFNHALQLSISLAAACGRLMALTTEQIAHAIAIAAIDNVSLAAVHSEPVSQWKGFSPAITAMRAVYTTALAGRGFTGPLRLFEGPNGLDRMFDQVIAIDWADRSLEVVRHTVLKKYCSLIHGQPVIEAVLGLRRLHRLSGADVTSVRCETFQGGFDIAGGGSFGPKDHPTTKEQADYNLKYLIAAALLDGQVGPGQLDEARVNAADTQDLLSRVEILATDEFSSAYPGTLGCRILLRMSDGRDYVRAQYGYEGGQGQPLSWLRAVEKFNWLAEPFADAAQREAIIVAVENLDGQPLTTLLTLLRNVSPHAVFPTTLPPLGPPVSHPASSARDGAW
jgi:2-methylcitrate dehydratase